MKTLFVDECKQFPFLLVGFVISNVKQQALRRKLREHLLAGQRSLHFKSENTRRKKSIVKALMDSHCQVVVVKCITGTNIAARYCALNALVQSHTAASCNTIVLELDETVRHRDHLFLKERQSFQAWDHRQRHEEPLLWVADAVAWCVNRGGEWERMVRPMIVKTIDCYSRLPITTRPSPAAGLKVACLLGLSSTPVEPSLVELAAMRTPIALSP